MTESIEWVIEDQTFSLSFDLAPTPDPSPRLPSAICLCFSVFPSLPTGGGGGEARSYDEEKA
jgi:hypothetical protein